MAGVFQQLLDAITGTLTTRAPAATKSTGTIGALNAEVVLAVPQGATAVTCLSTGTWTGALTGQFSFDGGVTYINSLFLRIDSANNPSATVTATGVVYVLGLLPGVTHVRARCTSYTSGSISTTLAAAVCNVPPPAPVAILGAGSSHVGKVGSAGMWFNHSVTPLAGGATFTGATIDATVAGTGTGFTNAAAYPKEVNIGAFADVTGTLQIEVSTDSTTWRLYDQIATTAVGAGFVAKLTYKPITRYWRVKYVNGAGAQTAFLLNSIAMAA